jgi:hypothetical protein
MAEGHLAGLHGAGADHQEGIADVALELRHDRQTLFQHRQKRDFALEGAQVEWISASVMDVTFVFCMCFLSVVLFLFLTTAGGSRPAWDGRNNRPRAAKYNRSKFT